VVRLPENHSALEACLDLLRRIETAEPCQAELLYLHGSSGVGKTFLVSALLEDARSRGYSAFSLSGHDFPVVWAPDDDGSSYSQVASDTDLLVVEDLQHLPARAADSFAAILDARRLAGRMTVVTATVGPAQLASRGRPLRARLWTRLAAGLVVAFEPLRPSSRLRILRTLADRRHLSVSDTVLAWLAQVLTRGGIRLLEGALSQIQTLTKLKGSPLTLDEARRHFEEIVRESRPTVDRIIRRVSAYYGVQPRHLRSARRHPALVGPRQLGMYLVRQLTDRPLQKIGADFGGRDHTTVLHACRKIAAALRSDLVLSGFVRQVQAEMT
jgi:chromosomal replication initiator protein